MARPVDVTLENHGHVHRLVLRTRVARRWVDDHVNLPEFRESRRVLYATSASLAPLVDGMREDGLRVRPVDGPPRSNAA